MLGIPSWLVVVILPIGSYFLSLLKPPTSQINHQPLRFPGDSKFSAPCDPWTLSGHIFVHGEDIVPKWRGLVAGSMVEFILYFDGWEPS